MEEYKTRLKDLEKDEQLFYKEESEKEKLKRKKRDESHEKMSRVKNKYSDAGNN